MKIPNTCLFLFLVIFSSSAFANQVCKIELVDGGVILGELVSHEGDIYRVRSKSLGMLTVKESVIRVIRFKSHHGESAVKEEAMNSPEQGVSPEMESLQKSMMNDQDVMSRIMTLQEDPKMQALLKDPEFMKAVYSGDIQTLMANPKFMELLNNPEIQEIQKKVLKP
ncbi:MAG: hypothetical protein LJE96_07015 [Deltaproteobacteria bacterium]|jgi:hypothetical protein|nr:hypothetical protein [Deltaproteobacteria bacterium]